MNFLLSLLIGYTPISNASQGFFKGEKVTCIYSGIFSWDNGDEFVKNILVQCKVLQVTGYSDEYSPGYQQIQVDCTDGLKDKWANGSGTGLVKNQKYELNKKILWYTSDECYHFGG